ncbi:Type II secretion system (T2SS), protein F [uncultured archaeon]|nr:Type II secretion system (T2SS), protein F [uncultured archaeon]
MEIQQILEKYSEWVEFSRMKINAPTWILISIVASVATALITALLSAILIPEVTLIPAAFTIAVLVLTIGYPYMRKESIVENIEKNFSDALKQMADTLKAGDTYEGALREVVESEYGRLSEEMSLALRRLEDGENLESALNGFAARIDSRLVKRTITIILDSIKTGASLADILDDIADDVKDFTRLKDERKANTTMQFLFLIAAGGVIAPLIFGEINSVLSAFSRFTSDTISNDLLPAAQQSSNFILTLIQMYIIITVLGSGTMMAFIRDGKLNKSIIYIPMLLVIAFIAYHVSSFVVKGMVAGAL